MEKLSLRELSEIKTSERSFLTVYLSKDTQIKEIEKKFNELRKILKSDPENKDELEYFNENVEILLSHLDENPIKSKGLCLFSCWVLNFFKAVEISVDIKDSVWVDSSPYIRPLAEFEDEYENYAVVLTDNNKSKIYLVAANKSQSEETVRGSIKNHVKVGGWSQKRYERRRDKELTHYAKDIIQSLTDLSQKDDFQRIILVGGKEIIQSITEIMPEHLIEKVIHKSVDLRKNEKLINQDIWELFQEMERKSEVDLWEKIREEFMRGGRAVIGIEDVLKKAIEYRIDSLIISRDFKAQAKRCRNCERIQLIDSDTCNSCNTKSLFTVDIINEIIELVKQSDGEVEFSDPITTLDNAGKIAAYLRY